MEKGRLIVVEDDRDQAQWYRQQLEGWGYKVEGCFSHAETALSKLEEIKPSLVVMDIVLAGDLDGMAATEIILKEYQIPVILLTASDNEDTFQQAKRLGVSHYLVKPVRPRELQVAVELTLSLYHSNAEVKKLLEERRELTASLTQEINRMTTFIIASTKVREMDRVMLTEKFCDWHELFNRYLVDIQKLTSSDYGAFGRFDSQGALVEVISSHDKPCGEDLILELAAQCKGEWLRVVREPGLLRGYDGWCEGENFRGLLCQNIEIEGDLSGFLCLANKSSGKEYSDLDMEVVSLYANELEKIITRKQLLSSLMEKNSELEENENRLVNQHSILAKLIGGDMQSCGELREEILELTEMISRSLSVDQVTVWMFNDSSGLPEKEWQYIQRTEEKVFRGGLAEGDYPKGIHRSLFSTVVTVSDVAEHHEDASFWSEYMSQRKIRGALYVPIWKEAGVVGAIAVEQYTARQWRIDENYFITALSEIISNHMLQCERARVQHELENSLEQLQEAQQQLLQSEKMASIGQLAAGVAHEINNPVGYINSNISSLRAYIDNLFQLIDAYQMTQPLLPEKERIELNEKEQQYDLSYLREDIQDLVGESLEGLSRVKQIVKDLKDFSHVGDAEWQVADLHNGIDSTLNIVWNEVKYKAEVIKNYGVIPELYCIPSQLNQVFMNMLVNAAHAIEQRGTITISTGVQGDDWVWVRISDTGSGISEEHIKRIFDPFFTTKPIGQGTGLGMSLSFSIVERHKGHIEIKSQLGKGTAFTIYLPIKENKDDELEAMGDFII